MSGRTKFKDLNHKGSTETLAKARLDLHEALALHELRKARGMTQEQLANSLDMKQSGVSRIEHQTDLFLSTLSGYVNALGGELVLSARFEDVEIKIKSLEAIEAYAPAEAETTK
jgi:transcriptional regulator with XRE-family HTH domain